MRNGALVLLHFDDSEERATVRWSDDEGAAVRLG
jgi:hypothetical protein